MSNPDLARRAVGATRWDWRDGMRDTQRARLVHDRWVQPADWSAYEFRDLGFIHLPDLDDGPTKGAILDLIREKRGNRYVYVSVCPPDFVDQWLVYEHNEDRGGAECFVACGATEAEALVAALEAETRGGG